MRVTEQIDALEIMGVNSANYLIFPKVVASVLINPVLIVISMWMGILGGWVAMVLSGLVTTPDYVAGIRITFDGYTIFYALAKTVVFAFIISSVSGFFGYVTEGGALQVGQASTKAVVYSRHPDHPVQPGPDTNSSHMIEARMVNKHFGDHHVLIDISLSFSSGENKPCDRPEWLREDSFHEIPGRVGGC